MHRDVLRTTTSANLVGLAVTRLPMIMLVLVASWGCSQLLDFSEVTGGEDGAGAQGGLGGGSGFDAGGAGATGDGGCEKGSLQCEGQCVDISKDPEHCGECQRSCGGGECKASACQPFVVGSLPGCHSVIPDEAAGSAYVTRWRSDVDKDQGGVYRIDLSSGKATPVGLGQAGAAWLVKVGSVLYWSNEIAPRGIWAFDLKQPSQGTTQLYPEAGDTTPRRPFGLAVADGNVYFADRGGAIGSVSAVNGVSFLYQNMTDKPLTLAVLDDWIYYTDHPTSLKEGDPPTHKVARLPRVKLGPAEAVLNKLHNPWGLQVSNLPDGSGKSFPNVFVSISKGAAIAKGTATGFKQSTVSNEENVPSPIGVDITLVGERLYWATRYGAGGSIQTYKLGEIGKATTLADTNHPVGLAHAGDFLYWCSFDFGLIRLRL